MCKINTTTGEYNCNNNLRGRCSVINRGAQGGANAFGFGASAGINMPKLRCDDKRDFHKSLNEKYPELDIQVED